MTFEISLSLAVPVRLPAPVGEGNAESEANSFSTGVKYSGEPQFPDLLILKMDGTAIRYSRAARKDRRICLDKVWDRATVIAKKQTCPSRVTGESKEVS